MSELNILTFTWNVGNASPVDGEISGWLPKGGGNLDLVVVGTQENGGWDKSKRTTRGSVASEQAASGQGASVTSPATPPKPAAGDAIQLADISVASTTGAWETMLEQRLGDKWMLVHHVELMQMRLCVFCLRANKDLVRNVQTAKSATGIGGAVGNKGGLVIGFTYGTTSFGFVSSHLAAHMGKTAARNADYWEVLRETRKQIGVSRHVDATASFDHVFWVGDLNYRIGNAATPGAAAAREGGEGDDEDDSPTPTPKPLERRASDSEQLKDTPKDFEAALALIKAKKYAQLLETDQLRQAQAQGTAFAGFKEGAIAFAPTFKVERGGGASYKQQRVPAYCDRVLWRSMPTLAQAVVQTHYGSVTSVTTSDHKPVVALFKVTPTVKVAALPPAVAERFPVVRLRDVRVFLKGDEIDFMSKRCDPYAVFVSHPFGLLGADAPATAIVKSSDRMSAAALAELPRDERTRAVLRTALTTKGKSDEQLHGYTWQWADKHLPLLRLAVAEAQLKHVALVVAMFDRDYASFDDSLGTVTIPLGRPPGARGTAEAYEFDVALEVPWEHGVGAMECTVAVSLGGQIESALGAAKKDRVGAAALSHSKLVRQKSCGGECEVQ